MNQADENTLCDFALLSERGRAGIAIWLGHEVAGLAEERPELLVALVHVLPEDKRRELDEFLVGWGVRRDAAADSTALRKAVGS